MKRKMLSLLLTAAMLLSLGSAAAAAGGPHWAQSAADRWQEAGVIQGDATGDLRLDDSLTRAELATVFVNLLGLTEEAPNTYADLTGGEWYAPAILKCTAAGIMQGDGSNCNAGATITRQETTVMTARALGIVPAEKADLTTFSDADQVADWASGYVAAMREQGIIQGMGDGTVAPAAQINRASMFTILDRAIPGYYGQAGSYQGDVSGSVLVSAPGVTLSNSKIAGDLLIAEGVGDGHVELDSVTVAGRVLVRGGGENSIIIKGDSQIGEIVVSRQNGKVRVSVEGGAEVEIIHVDDGSDAVKIEGTVGTVSISGADTDVEITGSVKEVQVAESAEGASLTVADGAEVDSVSLSAPKASLNVAGTVTKAETTQTATGAAVTVEKGAKVDTVTAAAPGSAVSVAGTVTKVETAETATGSKVETEKGASIKEVVANAEGTTVTGEAKVDKVTANADNTAVSTPNTKVEAGKDTTGVTVGDKEVKPGSSTTTNSSGAGTKPSGSGGSSHSHTYVNGVCASDGAISASATQVGTAEALNAALGDPNVTTIVLTDNIQVDEAITVERDLAINLHGNTLTSTYADVNAKPLVAVTVTGAEHTLTIDDYGSGKITTATASNTVMATAGGSVVLVKGTIENTGEGDYKALRAQGGNVTVQGGTVRGTNGYGLVIFGVGSVVTVSGGTVEGKLIGISSNGTKSVCNGYTLNISGGTIRNTDSTGDNDNAAIYLPGTDGKTTITGGEITGGRIGIAIRSGELTVNGGTITASAARNPIGALVSGVTGSYTGALVIGKPSSTQAGAYEGNIDVNITDGTIRNATGDALCVVHESKESIPAPGNVTVAVKSENLLTGNLNIQDGFGTVSGDSLTIEGHTHSNVTTYEGFVATSVCSVCSSRTTALSAAGVADDVNTALESVTGHNSAQLVTVSGTDAAGYSVLLDVDAIQGNAAAFGDEFLNGLATKIGTYLSGLSIDGLAVKVKDFEVYTASGIANTGLKNALMDVMSGGFVKLSEMTAVDDVYTYGEAIEVGVEATGYNDLTTNVKIQLKGSDVERVKTLAAAIADQVQMEYLTSAEITSRYGITVEESKAAVLTVDMPDEMMALLTAIKTHEQFDAATLHTTLTAMGALNWETVEPPQGEESPEDQALREALNSMIEQLNAVSSTINSNSNLVNKVLSKTTITIKDMEVNEVFTPGTQMSSFNHLLAGITGMFPTGPNTLGASTLGSYKVSSSVAPYNNGDYYVVPVKIAVDLQSSLGFQATETVVVVLHFPFPAPVVE